MAKAPIKILVVDDDENVLIALERLLEGEGYRTETAWSAREALALSKKAQFDLLLIDEYLSDLDVNALLDELKRTQPKAARFLMSTRHNGAERGPAKGHIAICKWEHGEVKARIQSYLAA